MPLRHKQQRVSGGSEMVVAEDGSVYRTFLAPASAAEYWRRFVLPALREDPEISLEQLVDTCDRAARESNMCDVVPWEAIFHLVSDGPEGSESWERRAKALLTPWHEALMSAIGEPAG